MLLSAEMLQTFNALFAEAQAAGEPEPSAMTLATTSDAGRVSARTVLLKHVDERGFVFYTNVHSLKGTQLAARPPCCPSYDGAPASIHVSLSAATDVDAFLEALRAAVDEAVRRGPLALDPGIVDLVAALDPTTLSDADFDGLLAAVGMTGGVGLPESMAEINALLDVAAPPLREAVLTAFLDRLQRPTP